ncbi:RHS repeat-associated core domain-containing protein [Empedobacter brevis]|uniref:RHS repeat-associated core domain-containing protein n=1 Tax=Empedobacter brevis TaxID=247 RepID=UPI0028A1FA77|nr:RHS repeat-associated core domain-containing protein [Empedobacter brevis]
MKIGIGIGSNSGSANYKYRYNGKELQDELNLNLYDYGARNYDPALGRWFNIDPLAEKYYSFSTYNYVLNSPNIAIDPDGMSVDTDYKLLQNGKVERVDPNDGSENDPTDTLYATNNNGSVNTNSSITVNKGTLDNIENTTFFDKELGENGKNVPIQIMDASSSTNSQGLFEFMANNSTSEFSITNFENGKTLIGTSFEYDAESSLNISWPKNGNIISFDHSHPMNDMISGADSTAVSTIKEKQPGTNPTFRIYTIYNGQYKTYDESGIELDATIIKPRKK